VTVDAAVQAGIHALWDELADFNAAQADAARDHLLGRLCRLIDSPHATWIGAVRLGDPQPGDPVLGWRVGVIRYLHPDPAFDRVAQRQSEELEAGIVDETTVANVAGFGAFRVNLLADLAPPGWFEGEFYRRFYVGSGRTDAVWAGVPVNADAESYFGFYRGPGQPRFGKAEKDIVAMALRGLRWFHRAQFLSEGLGVASEPLAPSERRVLAGLLGRGTEAAIAAELGLTPATVHTYATRIYRKFNVQGRAGLTALWLGQ